MLLLAPGLDKVSILQRKLNDDFDWPTYTNEYSKQIDEMVASGRDFLLERCGMGPDGIEFYDNLSDNWKEIYAQAYALQPKTIFECGCGAMYNLRNLKKLLPHADVYGCDLLISQIFLGAMRFGIGMDILKGVRVLDLTEADATKDLKTYEFVYTQAVVMHLNSDKAVAFVRNMMKIADRHMMFIEDIDRQNWQDVMAETDIASEFDMQPVRRYTKNGLLFTRRQPRSTIT